MDNVVGELGWGRTKLIRIESAKVRLSAADLRKLGKLYGADANDLARLHELMDAAGSTPWFAAYTDLLTAALMEYIELEAMAAQIHMANTGVLPGLLQSRSYATAVYESQPHIPDPDQAARLVEVRMKRQRVITEDGVPLRAIIGQALLHVATGGRDVLKEQLGLLAEMSELANVELRVVPFSAERAILTSGISVFDFDAEPGGDQEPSVAFTEHEGSMLLRDAELDVRRFRRLLDHLATQSLDPDESRHMITKRMEEL
ncbi:DUF5753 domain-containing protein [Yinghuangia sp. KLBMP8922]|uniref:DUF5753 domain-containing protein n=1 Tax=Yinghuangia soli TaxID=2908204 RepID=A0AA41U8R7_9ACTN|nr:DUF5753 domain-containing protein [Yinghuangia soli]